MLSKSEMPPLPKAAEFFTFRLLAVRKICLKSKLSASIVFLGHELRLPCKAVFFRSGVLGCKKLVLG
jgi:hypothetical protein